MVCGILFMLRTSLMPPFAILFCHQVEKILTFQGSLDQSHLCHLPFWSRLCCRHNTVAGVRSYHIHGLQVLGPWAFGPFVEIPLPTEPKSKGWQRVMEMRLEKTLKCIQFYISWFRVPFFANEKPDKWMVLSAGGFIFSSCEFTNHYSGLWFSPWHQGWIGLKLDSTHPSKLPYYRKRTRSSLLFLFVWKIGIPSNEVMFRIMTWVQIKTEPKAKKAIHSPELLIICWLSVSREKGRGGEGLWRPWASTQLWSRVFSLGR